MNDMINALLNDFISTDSKFIMMPLTELNTIKGDQGINLKVYSQRGDVIFEDNIYCKRPLFNMFGNLAIQTANSGINLAFDKYRMIKHDAILL